MRDEAEAKPAGSRGLGPRALEFARQERNRGTASKLQERSVKFKFRRRS